VYFLVLLHDNTEPTITGVLNFKKFIAEFILSCV